MNQNDHIFDVWLTLINSISAVMWVEVVQRWGLDESNINIFPENVNTEIIYGNTVMFFWFI